MKSALLSCAKTLSKSLLTIFVVLFAQDIFGQTVLINPPSPWTVPSGVTSFKVEVWGGGGGGGGSAFALFATRFGGGGGGGANSSATFNASGGQIYTFTIGQGGSSGSNANGGNGGSTTFSGPAGTVTAGGGGGGVRSSSATGGAAGIGNRNGGVGGTGTSNGAGGGAGAGNASAGANGANTGTALGGAGTPNIAPYIGGNGGAARTTTTNDGFAGGSPGGGGGGGKSNTAASSGGDGGDGQIIITYTCPTYSFSGINASSPICVNSTSVINVNASANGLPVGTYTVTYNLSAPNAATGLTATMNVSSPGAGSFNATGFTNSGFTTLTITNIRSGTTTGCSNNLSFNNTAVITVNPLPTANAGSALPTICQGGTSAPLGATAGGSATGGTWTTASGGTFNPNANSLSATWTPPAAFTGTATLTFTTTGGTCGTANASKTQLVNPAPSGLMASPLSSAICLGSTVSLTGSATVGSSATIIENFNGVPTFTGTGSTTGDRSQIWQKETSGTNINSVATFTSPGGGSLMVSTAGSSNAFGASSANSTLTSGSINTTGFSSLSTLSFNHSYKQGGNSGSGTVQVSTNGGSTWTTALSYNSNQGSAGGFVSQSINFAPYVNMTNVRLRFVFVTSNQNLFSNTTSWWAVDDIILNGTRIPLYTWTANTAPAVNGLPAGSGTPSAANANIIVSPTTTTVYSLTATNPSTGCVSQDVDVSVTVYPAPSLMAPADTSVYTSDDNSGNCSTTYSWLHPVVNTACPTTLAVAYTAGSPAPSGLPANGTVTPGAAASAEFFTGVTTVTYTATDQNNNTANTSFTITVADNERPDILCSADVTISNEPNTCHATVTLVPPVTSDNCGVASVTNDHPSDVYPVGTTEVTWTVEDINNNVSFCVQQVTVNDSQLPTITCAANVSMNTDPGSCSALITLSTPSTADNCGVASVINDHPSNVYALGNTTVRWTVTDNSGNIATCDQVVTVTDNQLPSITCPLAVTTMTDSASAFATITLQQPVVSDNCGILTTVNNHPSTSFPIGTTIVTWTVTDVNGNANTCEQTILVNDLIFPDINCNAPITINNLKDSCSGLTDVTYPAASDNSGHVTVTADYSGLPIPSVDPVTPLIVNSVLFPVGMTTVIWTAIDPSDNTSWCSQTFTVVDNENPTITCNPAHNQYSDAGACSAVINLSTPATSDNCGVLSVTKDHPSNVYPVGQTLVTWTVTDIHGNTSSCTQLVTVIDQEIPAITCAANVSVSNDLGQCSAEITLTAPATSDNCAVATVVSDHPSNLFTEGTTTVIWTVTDIHGNINTCTQQITVTDNEAPVFTRPADIIIYTNADCVFDASIAITGDVTNESDNCSAALEATFSDAVTPGICTGSQIITRTWSLVDNHNNSAANQVQIITVNDNLAPTFTRPADTEIVTNENCQYNASLAITGDVSNESDNCSTGLQATFFDVVTPGACEGSYLITRTWSLVDDCSNSAPDQVQLITVSDNIVPTFTRPADIVIYTDAACAYDATVTATGDVTDEGDNCSTSLNAHFTDILNSGSCTGSLTITRTWTLADNCGNNAAPQVQTITITDTLPPTFTRPADIEIFTNAGCGYDVTLTNTGDVTDENDNCSTGLQATYSDEVTAGQCPGAQIITRTWSLSDNCGNTSTQQQVITVTDNTVPSFTHPEDIEIFTDANCGYDASLAVTGDVTDETDNCSSALQATYSDAVMEGTCTGSHVITRTWMLADNCGNQAENQVQIIRVTDNTAPVITTCAPSVTVVPNNAGCTSILLDYRASVVATDNCSGVVLTQSPAPGTALQVGANTVSITATDACGNNSVCNFLVTVNKTLNVTVTNSNPQLYYGYSLDQSTVIRGTPTGGTGPYKIVITMNRALRCNLITATGDEKWVANGGSSVGSTCPSSGPGSTPVSTLLNVAAGGSYSVTATLLANAVFTVTVTDANGCTVSKTTNVNSEDARCLAGASGNTKIKICHRTGNAQDPCHVLCVPESAVAAHLAHGDFLGDCTTNCVAPAAPLARGIATPEIATIEVEKFGATVSPNPSTSQFRLSVTSPKSDRVNYRVMDLSGKTKEVINSAPNTTIQLGDRYFPGVYIVEIVQGSERIVMKLIKL